MRRSLPLLSAFLVVSLALVGGCSKDACEEGYEKRQECAASMDCGKMGPGGSTQCENTKKEYQADYLIYQTACRNPDGSTCTCEGAELEKWERILNCTLEPNNMCQCR